MKINTQGIVDNLQHTVGNLVGLTILKVTGGRYSKDQRGKFWFSTVAANNAADGFAVWLPYRVLIK